MGVFGVAIDDTITELGIIVLDIECTKTTETPANDIIIKEDIVEDEKEIEPETETVTKE